MPRLQLALNVSNLEEAVSFYSRLFGTPPAKQREGYANFAIEQPPLKLVLFEASEQAGQINHIGVEYQAAGEVEAAQQRVVTAGLSSTDPAETDCCHARQEKAWVKGPDGLDWELYRVLQDLPAEEAMTPSGAVACCAPGEC